MNNLNLDKYLEIVNEEMATRGLETYIPLYPMLRVENEKLFIAIMIVSETAKVWNKETQVKPEYWALIDVSSNQIVEFNQTFDKDYVNGMVIPKNVDDKQKEMSKYTIEKALQYKEYLINDIKNARIPLQDKLTEVLGSEIEIDGEKVININDYLMSDFEEEVKTKIDELVGVLIQSKQGSLIFYYDMLFNNIIDTYKNCNVIDVNKIKLCIEIMNNYYDGVITIDNFFNVN